MGKGYHNFMTKKFFHPTSGENIKRKWMSEQKRDFDQKKEDDLTAAREAEQSLLNKKIAMGDKHAILGLSWMYEQPTIVEKKDDKSEKKFEWQRNYTAPREEYIRGATDINDQPFGIEVKNVRCLKCHQWGHVNSDKVCPMFHQNMSQEPTTDDFKKLSMHKLGMLSNGLQYSKQAANVLPNVRIIDPYAKYDDDLPESVECLMESLPAKAKEKLLKKLGDCKNLSVKEMKKKIAKLQSEKKSERKHKTNRSPRKHSRDRHTRERSRSRSRTYRR